MGALTRFYLDAMLGLTPLRAHCAQRPLRREHDAVLREWAGSVLIMGSCRTLLYLVAGSAVTGKLSWNDHQELCVKAIALVMQPVEE